MDSALPNWNRIAGTTARIRGFISTDGVFAGLASCLPGVEFVLGLICC
jgi:hypothetical protein